MIEKKYTLRISDSFKKMDENIEYEVVFHRYLILEFEEVRMSIKPRLCIRDLNEDS